MDNNEHFDDEIDLIDYLKVIYKYRIMVIIFVFAGMLFAGTSTLLKPNVYEATATFFPMTAPEYGGAERDRFTIRGQLGMGDLAMSILQSKTMADRIIQQLNLKDVWNTKLTTDTQDKLRDASRIQSFRDGLIKVSVVAESPVLSANIANAYVDNLEYFNENLNLGAQKKIVLVIDRASIPEKRKGRGTVRTTLTSGIISFVFSALLAFFIESLGKHNVLKRLRE